MLNLAINLLDKSAREAIEGLIGRVGEGFQLVLKENNFDEKTKEVFRKKHLNKVFI
jgi:hypothetical protein